MANKIELLGTSIMIPEVMHISKHGFNSLSSDKQPQIKFLKLKRNPIFLLPKFALPGIYSFSQRRSRVTNTVNLQFLW